MIKNLLINPEFPNIIINEITAIITGKINGAPRNDKIIFLNIKFLLANALATGIANKQLTSADKNACQIVNFIIRISFSPSAKLLSDFKNTASKLPKVSTATDSATRLHKITISFCAPISLNLLTL